VRAVGQRDPTSVTLGHAGASFSTREEREVEADDRVARVVDDVRELVVEEPRVDRVDHRAHARDCVVQLEVAKAVPREGADAIALADAQATQRVGEPARARVRVAIG
jgi:hypothetical protein